MSDFSLNIANELSAAIFSRWGLDRLTASYDLDDAQLFAMLRHFPAERLEVVIRQRVPMFHIVAATPYLPAGPAAGSDPVRRTLRKQREGTRLRDRYAGQACGPYGCVTGESVALRPNRRGTSGQK